MQEKIRNVRFCQWCGGQTKHGVPDGEEKLRAICTVCGKITYQNPKMVIFLYLHLTFDNNVQLPSERRFSIALTVDIRF